MKAHYGFSLIEMTVVLVVVLLLLGGLLVPLETQVEQRKVFITEKKLEEIKEALIGYAIAMGRLPCPASGVGTNAVESFTATGSISNGDCSNFFDGFLPAVTLGLTETDSQGYSIDGWGLTQNRIRYAVSNHTVNGVTNPFTRVDGMKSAGINTIATAPLLYVCSSGVGVTASDCGTATTLTSNAPAIVYSVGKNAPVGGAGTDEAENPNPNGGSANRIFVSHVQATSAAPGGEFDDIVNWLSPNVLFNRMIAAGRLP